MRSPRATGTRRHTTGSGRDRCRGHRRSRRRRRRRRRGSRRRRHRLQNLPHQRARVSRTTRPGCPRGRRRRRRRRSWQRRHRWLLRRSRRGRVLDRHLIRIITQRRLLNRLLRLIGTIRRLCRLLIATRGTGLRFRGGRCLCLKRLLSQPFRIESRFLEVDGPSLVGGVCGHGSGGSLGCSSARWFPLGRHEVGVGLFPGVDVGD
jgi:hypothetical protein